MTRRQIQPEMPSDESDEPQEQEEAVAPQRPRAVQPREQAAPAGRSVAQQGQSAARQLLRAIQRALPVQQLLWILGMLLVGVVIYLILRAISNGPLPPSISGFKNDQILPTLFSLAVVALFLERAIEVLINISRGPAKVELEKAVAAARGGTDRSGLAQKEKALEDYTAGTRRFARFIAFCAGLAISFLGARILEPILGGSTVAPRLKDIATFIDVVVTALVIAGGSDEIHRMIKVYSYWVDEQLRRRREKSTSH